MLQAILRRKCDGRGEDDSYLVSPPERFWIIHQLSNVASARGIARAGFRIACKVYFSGYDSLVLVASVEESRRALVGAELLGLPLLEETSHSQLTN